MGTDAYSIQTGIVTVAIIIGGFLMIIGKKHAGGNIIFTAVLITFLAPFLMPVATQYMDGIPVFVFPILGVILLLLIIQAVVSTIFGRRVGDSVVAGLLASTFKLIAIPFMRLMQWIGRLLQR